MKTQHKEQLLLNKMSEAGISQQNIANLIKKSKSVVSRKINNEVKFTTKEKATIAEFLQMTDAEKIKFFYD
ncbi:hypothetical protein [Enterococcus sp. DIV0187]|uniref:hypothetical protein n=1 Tax=Enterococcus sp. DIV0187 TaxID=2774644 RepID=UPI003F210BBB